jgi:phospholipid/cholesterol/gamma-HCH transport system substrate-binding protein
METRASYVAVGAFVVLLAAALAGFVVWLGKFQDKEGLAYYDVRLSGSVTGLQEGGTVRYRGIPVGSVFKLQIDPEDIQLVRATIRIRRDTPVRTDTVASLELQGVTGVSYILLSGGSQTAESLPVTREPPYPVITSKPSTIEQLFEGAPDLVNRLNELVGNINQLFDDNNRAAISDTLANLQTVTGALADNAGGIAQLLSSGAHATDEVAAMSAEFTALAKDVRVTMKDFSGDGRAALKDMRATAQAFTGAADQLEAMINENRTSIRDFTSTGAYELTQLFSELRFLVSALSRVTEQIERDPARFLFGDRGRGFEAQ